MAVSKLSKADTLTHVSGNGSVNFSIDSTTTSNGTPLGSDAYRFTDVSGSVTLNTSGAFVYATDPSPSLIGESAGQGKTVVMQAWGQTYSGNGGYIRAEYTMTTGNTPASQVVYAEVSGGGTGRTGGKATCAYIGTPGNKSYLWGTAGAGGGPGSNSGGRPAGYPTGTPNPCGWPGGGQSCPGDGLTPAGSGDNDGPRGNYGGGGGAGYCRGSGSGHCGPLGFRTGGAGGSNGFTLGENATHHFPGNGQPNYTSDTTVRLDFG